MRIDRTWKVKALVALLVLGGVIGLGSIVGSNWEVHRPHEVAADGYLTVFEIGWSFWAIVLKGILFYVIGVAGLTVAIILRRRFKGVHEDAEPDRIKRHKNQRNHLNLCVVVASIWVLVASTILPVLVKQSFDLLHAYQSGQASIVEGTVTVRHEQPVTGHDKADIVRVDGAELRVHHFRLTPAYKATIAHGGALTQGAKVRVWHVGTDVLRVDVYQP